MASEHLDRLKIHVKSVDQNVEDLSGGQRQAVAIARATAFDAKVVIMDEPTAALAIKEVGKVLDLIKSLKDHGVAVIIISHRMDDIFYACDRVMALYQGTNFAEAPLDRRPTATRSSAGSWAPRATPRRSPMTRCIDDDRQSRTCRSSSRPTASSSSSS